eukprot:Em1347g1a
MLLRTSNDYSEIITILSRKAAHQVIEAGVAHTSRCWHSRQRGSYSIVLSGGYDDHK